MIKAGDDGLIHKQGKKVLKILLEEYEKDPSNPQFGSVRNVLPQTFTKGAVDAALRRDINWLRNNLQSNRQRSILYPINVVENFGINVLIDVLEK